MAYNLLRCERDQSYLMPPSMRDWLSEGHLAWFIVDAVGQMDLREFYAAYRSDGWGAAAYDPTMAHTLKAAGIEDRPKAGLADAGCWSEANIGACSWPEMPELLIATTKDWKQRKMLREKGCPRGRIPKGLSPRDRMERKLLTKRGRALYKKRGVLVEPVFGQVKEGQGFRRFMRRGLGAAQSEWSLAGMTHNLLKLWRSGQAPWGWA